MNREILRLAVPNILSNISVPLLSSFDTVLMGGLGGGHIAAVGLGAMAFNFVYWNFGFLRMSTTGLTAQAFGAADGGGQRAVLRRAALLAAGGAALLVLLQYPLAELTHRLLNLRPEQIGLVDDYFYVRIWAAPAALLQMVVFGWFFGRQRATVPLVLTLVINVVNMGASYYLVQHAGWGIRGVAWGTVVAQYVGLTVGAGWLWRALRAPDLAVADPVPNPAPSPSPLHPRPRPNWSDLLRINADIFLRTLCLTLSFAFFYNRANALDVGTAVVAANVILLQLVNWLSYGVDGFAFAAESLVGKYTGARQPGDLRRAIRLVFGWGMGLAAVYALGYTLGGTPLLALFAPTAAAPATLAAAAEFLPLVVVFCLAASPCYLLDGVYVGLTASRAMRQTMLLAFGGYLVIYFLVGRHFGNTGLWASLLAFMVLRALLQALWLRRGRVLPAWARQQ